MYPLKVYWQAHIISTNLFANLFVKETSNHRPIINIIKNKKGQLIQNIYSLRKKQQAKIDRKNQKI